MRDTRLESEQMPRQKQGTVGFKFVEGLALLLSDAVSFKGNLGATETWPRTHTTTVVCFEEAFRQQKSHRAIRSSEDAGSA